MTLKTGAQYGSVSGGAKSIIAQYTFVLRRRPQHNDVTQHKNTSLCRTRAETRTCVGKVAYFVKCTLANKEAKQAAKALQISTGTHRFAIVDAWTVEDVQHGISDADYRQDWAKHAAKVLTQAKLLRREHMFRDLLLHVQEDATVLAMSADTVMIRNQGGRGGTLKRLAVPVSSLYEQYYGRPAPDEANWAVHPLVRIDKRKVSLRLGIDERKDTPTSRAIKCIRGRSQYFVHTYSKSNSQL
jgi:hypothetical protein